MYLSKYGVARHIYIPIVARGVADYAVGATWTPAAGDVKISKDGGAAANVTNLPSAIVMGNVAMWDFSLTATEMEAAQVKVTVGDSATKAVEDDMFTIETYGHASAQHAFDLDTAITAPANFSSMSITAGGLVDITQAAADKVWGTASRTLTAFSTGLAVSVWDVLTAAIGTANSIGTLLTTNINATVSSRASQASVDVIDDLLDTEFPALVTAVGDVKAQTDKLGFNAANRVLSDIRAVNDTAIQGVGTLADPWRPV